MKDDYSGAIFSMGLVCYNTNNNTYCIVIDGHKGVENDRCSLVLEFQGKGELLIHTPPNRALKPTGRIAIHRLEHLKKLLDQYVFMPLKEEI